MGLLFSKSTEVDNDKEFLVIKEKQPGRSSNLLFGTVTLMVLSMLLAGIIPQIEMLFGLLFFIFAGLILDFMIENYQFYLGRVNGKEIRMKGSLYYSSQGPYEAWIAK